MDALVLNQDTQYSGLRYDKLLVTAKVSFFFVVETQDSIFEGE